MKGVERSIENALLASRWLLLVFYAGLAIGLALYAASFLVKLYKLAATALTSTETQLILSMLGLIDSALVASLVVMVMISGYENFISRFDNPDVSSELTWLGKLDAGSLKIKVASSIVAISSIHLLQVFLNAPEYSNDKIMWVTLIHLTFVISALLLGYLDRLTSAQKH